MQYIDLWPDPAGASCMSAYNRSVTASYVGRTPAWAHLAVTWTAANGGLTKIYKDGLLMTQAGYIIRNLNVDHEYDMLKVDDRGKTINAAPRAAPRLLSRLDILRSWSHLFVGEDLRIYPKL